MFALTVMQFARGKVMPLSNWAEARRHVGGILSPNSPAKAKMQNSENFRVSRLFADRVFRMVCVIPHTTVCWHASVYDVTLLQRTVVYLQHGSGNCSWQNGVTVTPCRVHSLYCTCLWARFIKQWRVWQAIMIQLAIESMCCWYILL